MSYEESIQKLGDFVGTELWHDYMGGAFIPSCREYLGIIITLSMVYGKSKNRVMNDIDLIAEAKEKELTNDFKNKKYNGRQIRRFPRGN